MVDVTKKKARGAYNHLSLFGKVLANFADGIDDFLHRRKSTLDAYIPVDGFLDEAQQIAFLSDNTMFSMLEISGSISYFGEDNIAHVLTRLRETLGESLRHSGTSIQVVYERDRARAREYVERMIKPSWDKARRMKFDADPLFRDQIDALVPVVTGLRVWLVVYTSSKGVIPVEQLREHYKEFLAKAGPMFPTYELDTIKVFREPMELVDRHSARMQSIRELLTSLSVVHAQLDGRAMMIAWLSMLFPELVEGWEPRIGAEDDYQARHGESDPRANPETDLEPLLLPSLGRQLALGAVQRPRSVDPIIEIGDRYVASAMLQKMPSNPSPFREFLNRINDLEVNFRISFYIVGGHDEALGSVRRKRTMAYFGQLLPGNPDRNKRIAKSADALIDKADHGEIIVMASVVISTWHHTRPGCKQNLTRLQNSLNAWGNAQTEAEYGDPLKAFLTSMPGWAPVLKNKVERSLSKILPVLPLFEMVSPWNSGNQSMFWVSESNQLFPFEVLSDRQQTTNIGISAPPGSGKSQTLANILISAVFDPTQPGLPKVFAADIGGSMQGPIDMLKSLAPPELKDQFKYIDFDFSGTSKINPLDLRTGCTTPSSSEKGFQKAIMRFIMAENNGAPITADMERLIALLLNEAYQARSESDPVPYDKNKDPEVANWVSEHINPDYHHGLTWYQIVFESIKVERFDIAGRAQRFAVPTVAYLPTLLSNSRTITDLCNSNELFRSVVQQAKLRLMTFVANFPMLCEPSTLVFQATDIVVFDLTKVTRGGKESPEGALAYMIARFMVGKDFLVGDKTLDELPAPARLVYGKYIEKYATVRKYLIYDEVHTVKKFTATLDLMEDDSRNGRKFNMCTIVASQSDCDDFHSGLRDQFSVVLAMKVPDENIGTKLGKLYAWPESLVNVLHKKATGLGGGQVRFFFYAQMKPKHAVDASICQQFLVSRSGPITLAACSTIREPASLRAACVRAGGSFWGVTRAMAKLYPGESFKEEYTRVKDTSKGDDLGVDENVLAPYVDKILKYMQTANLS